jgi:2-polyprenyl-3-methyl-5-hydroxy-6-metoxy-1,4-benzoquinol methylase
MTEIQHPPARVIRVLFGALFPRFVKPESWDRDYAAGEWDWLSTDTEQMGHHMAVLGFISRARKNPRILDVGCGAGPLYDYVQKIGMPTERYLGIDISAEAVKKAAQLGGHAEWQAHDAAEFTTDEKFDAIVFNEVAWYFKDPGEVLARYSTYLRDGGVLILSMFDVLPARSMWRSVFRRFEIADEVQVKSKKGHRWNVRLLTKKA